jgi:repressor LexA
VLRTACRLPLVARGSEGGALSSRPLTDRQQTILDFIVSTIRTRGFPPTLREIGQAFEIRSTKGVNDHLEALERKGRIRRQKDLSRAIEVVGMPSEEDADSEAVPVLGRIAAGAPILAAENVETSYRLDRSLLHGERNFLLRVQGDSMIDAHICDSDYVLVRPQDSADTGDIVVALVDDEATVKYLERDGRRIRLQPANPTVRPILVEPGDPLRILGKVVGVLRVM